MGVGRARVREMNRLRECLMAKKGRGWAANKEGDTKRGRGKDRNTARGADRPSRRSALTTKRNRMLYVYL